MPGDPASSQGPGEATRVVVVGAGVSGLAAGYRVLTRAPEVDLRVLEGSTRAGGLIGTVRQRGFVVEQGPDSVLSEKPWGISLLRRLGLGDEIIGTRQGARGAYVVARGKLVRVPSGFSMVAPTHLGPLLSSQLLSVGGKLRACWDLVAPRGPQHEDESLAAFVSRRFGRQVLDRLVQPLVSGVYGADPERLSVRATLPRFVELEAEKRSVLRALRRTQDGQRATGARYGLFVSLRSGMGTLTDELANRLGSCLCLSSSVRSITRTPGHYQVHLERGQTLRADRVVVALPADHAAQILCELDSDLAELLRAVSYGSVAIASFGWPLPAMPRPLDAFGWVAPKIERRSLMACTWSSVKFEGRAPEGHLLLRAFFGGARCEQLLQQRSDRELLDSARSEIASLTGIAGEPGLERLDRHVRSMPQYHVGHLKLVRRIEQRAARHPGLALAGAAFRGVGIPDAVRSGEAAAEAVLAPWAL
ncbi:MAG: protoporphyrinogen oxidase [Proteobacteria bacterium]|nr:protoporphyrinogen oxidase [Pseudomonadota bacterium]